MRRSVPRCFGRASLLCAVVLCLLGRSVQADTPTAIYWDWPVGECVEGRFAPGYGYTIEQDYANKRPFGPRCTQEALTNDCFHAGLDIYLNDGGNVDSTGQPVFAAADGRVIAIIDWGTEGYGVLAEHGSRYAQYVHLNPGSVVVEEGQPIRRGQYLGNITRYPDGPSHVHFEARPGVKARFCPRRDGSDKRCPAKANDNALSCRGNGYSLIPHAEGTTDHLSEWGFRDPADIHFNNRPSFPTDVAADEPFSIRDSASTAGNDIGDLPTGVWIRGTNPPVLVRGAANTVLEAWYPVTTPDVAGFSRSFAYNGWDADMVVSEQVRVGRQWQPPNREPVVDVRFGDGCAGVPEGTVCSLTDAPLTNYAVGGGGGFVHGTLLQPPPYPELPTDFCDHTGELAGGTRIDFDLPSGVNFRNGVQVELAVRLDDLGSAGRQVLAAQGAPGAEAWALTVEPGLAGQRRLRFEVRLADGSARRIERTLPEPYCVQSQASACAGDPDLAITAPNCAGVSPACDPGAVSPGCVSDYGYRQWRHVAARALHGSGTIELYWDGAKLFSAVDPLPSFAPAAGPIRIGEGLRGTLDNVMIWAYSGNVELDPDPITGPATADESSPVTFSTAVRNRGNADSGPFRVRWWIDGTVVATTDHPSIAPNSTAPPVSIPWTATEPPTHHTVFFYADVDLQVAEVNERNNDASGAIDVIPEPDPCQATTGVCEPPPNTHTHPDLHPLSLDVLSGELIEGREITFSSSVENRGQVSAPAFYALWQVDNETRTDLLVHHGIGPRSSTRDHNIDFTWKAEAGRRRILVWLDPPPGLVTEANELNNRRALSLDIAPAADLHPTGIVPTPTTIRPGEPVFLDVGVENLGSLASGGFNVRWRIDGEIVAAGFHGSVAGHSSVGNGNSQLTWTFEPGPHEVVFEVDYDGRVVEGDEENNTTTFNVGNSGLVRVDTEPVTINGQKELDKLFDGLTWWPNTAIIHFVPNTPVAVKLEYATAQTLEAFRVSMAGVEFGGDGNGTYRFKVETAGSWNGPFTTVVASSEIDCRIEVATVRLPAPATAKVFKVTATRANGDGIVHWLELEPIPDLAAAGFPYGLARVDTDPVAIQGQKDLGRLLDGVIAWPNTAVVHFVANADVTAVLEFDEETFLSGFWTSVAGTDFGGSHDGTYVWNVEAGDSWNGPFNTIVSGYETDSRDGLAEIPFLASVRAKVYRVTANRTNGDGVVHWLELGPILIRP